MMMIMVMSFSHLVVSVMLNTLVVFLLNSMLTSFSFLSQVTYYQSVLVIVM